MIKSIGIDLGTTYSCVIHHSETGERIVENIDDRELTPSVVYFDSSGDVLVGDQAKDRLADDIDNTVVGIKRQMGREFPLSFGGRVYTPEGISGIILRRLAEDAASFLGVQREELRAVVTVPAYFGVGEREATYAAARIAELECLELLPEPVAAAYAYGLSEEPNKTSLVYDLGGGTFDVAVVGMSEGKPKVWAVDGDVKLGGLDWDVRIQDLLWQRVMELDNAEDLRYDDEVVGIITAAAELLKRRLTTQESVKERVILQGQRLELLVTRTEFNESASDLVLRTQETSARVIEAARAQGAPDIDQVLLVGGSTRMPMIRDSLSNFLNVEVKLADPDKAVARGAAILAEQLVAHTAKSNNLSLPRITSVLPKSIGILTYSSRAPYREEPYIDHFLSANMQLPIVGYEHTIATVTDDQERAKIQIFEQAGTRQSDVVADNRLLVEGEIVGIPRRPAGSPIKLKVSVATDGRISVESLDGSRPTRLEVEAFMHGVLDDAEILQQQEVVSGLRLV